MNDNPAMLSNYDAADDFLKSYAACLQAVRERIAQGGPGWTPKPATFASSTPTIRDKSCR
jgi:hypothetical protein